VRYEKHIFICTNRREPGSPRGSCAEKGSEELRARFKEALKERGLHRTIRANASGCLDACEFGPSVVVYPDAVWYGAVAPEDVDEIIESHLIRNVPVERLLIRDRRYTPEPLTPDSSAEFGSDPEEENPGTGDSES
jgi:(2Fe-2S) ferredoxin